jgi:hypothetical protein
MEWTRVGKGKVEKQKRGSREMRERRNEMESASEEKVRHREGKGDNVSWQIYDGNVGLHQRRGNGPTRRKLISRKARGRWFVGETRIAAPSIDSRALLARLKPNRSRKRYARATLE